MRFTLALPDLVMASGDNVSNVITSEEYEDAESISFVSPADLGAGTYTFEVSNDYQENGAAAQWGTLEDIAGTPISVPGAGKSFIHTFPAHRAIRIKSSVGAAADYIWKMAKQVAA